MEVKRYCVVIPQNTISSISKKICSQNAINQPQLIVKLGYMCLKIAKILPIFVKLSETGNGHLYPKLFTFTTFKYCPT